MKRVVLALAVAFGTDGLAHVAAPPQSSQSGELLQNASVKAALASARASEPQTIEDQIRFCEIPAPPFKEETRGKELQRVFQQLGLEP